MTKMWPGRRFAAVAVVACLVAAGCSSVDDEAGSGEPDRAVQLTELSIAPGGGSGGGDSAAVTVNVIASGDYAVLVLSAVEAGNSDDIPREERNLQRLQLAEQTTMSEITGYAAEVRNQATVRIPDIVLNPIF